MNKFLLLILSVGIFSGCSIWPKLGSKSDSENVTTKKWSAHAVWVQSTLKKENHLFRKINRMSPLIYKDLVLAGNALDGLVAYDLQSKKELWRVAIPFGVEASAALINDRLFVGGNDGKLYSIDLKSRQVLWAFDTNSEVVAEPLLHEGVLYFLSGSQTLFAVDAVSGKQLWIYNRQDTRHLMTIRGGSKPAISNGLLYLGFSDGSVVSINAKTGSQQWEILLNRNSRFSDIDSSPVVDGDKIFINSYDDKIYALSKANGEIIWSAPFGGPNTPLVFGDKLVVTSSKGDLVTFNKKDGQILWKTTSKNGIFSEASIYNGLVIAGESQGSLKTFDIVSGEQKTAFEPGRGVFSKPTVHAPTESVYFISGEGHIYQIKLMQLPKSFIPYL